MSDAFSVRHNIGAMFAHRQAGLNNGSLTKALERLSSGYRVNRAADDAAGLAVSEKLRTQVRGYHQAAKNIQDGVSLLQTTEAAASDVTDILQRIRELLVQAANGVFTESDRILIQEEIDEMLSEIDRIHEQSQFNGRRLFEYTAADIVWIIDGSASMGPEQAALSNAAPAFVNELIAKGIDYRLGVVKFGHLPGDGEVPAIQGSMTTDTTTFSTNVTAVGTGGSGEEDGMEALNAALTLHPYRQNARKVFIVMTDEDSDDGVQPPVNDIAHTDITVQTRQNMVDNDVIVFVMATAGSGATTEEAYSGVPGSQGVPAATGGTRYTSLTGSFASELANGVKRVLGENVDIHVGANESQATTLSVQNPINTASLGIGNGVTTATQGAAETAIVLVNGALEKVTTIRSKIGAELNRLEYAYDSAVTIETNMQSSESRIRDADMAAEISGFTQAQVIAQAAQAMLAQANLRPQNILALLG